MNDLFSVREVGAIKAAPGARFNTGLVIPFWNRPDYLRRILASLCASALEDVIVILADDASEDPRIAAVLENHGLPAVPMLYVRRRQRAGIKINESLCFAWDLLDRQYSCEHFALLDSDMVVRPYWLEKLRTVHKEAAKKHARCVLTGFNTFRHPILRHEDSYCIKKSIGGCSLFFERTLYRGLVRPCLVPGRAGLHWDWSLVQLCHTMRVPLVCTCPSVVQHTGRQGTWSRGLGRYDWAPDYYFGRIFTITVYPLLFAIFELRRRLSFH